VARPVDWSVYIFAGIVYRLLLDRCLTRLHMLIVCREVRPSLGTSVSVYICHSLRGLPFRICRLVLRLNR
jgi:hypothetical protein